MSRVAPNIKLPRQVKEQLEKDVQSGKDARLVLRASIVLAAAQGMNNARISQALNITVVTVGKWRRRFFHAGFAGLHDEARSGRHRKLASEERRRLVQEGRWPRKTNRRLTCAQAAVEFGVSKSTVHRIWTQQGIRRRHHLPDGLVPGSVKRGWGDLHSLHITGGLWIATTLCQDCHWQWEDGGLPGNTDKTAAFVEWRLVAGINCLSRRMGREKGPMSESLAIASLEETIPTVALKAFTWHVLLVGASPQVEKRAWDRIRSHPCVCCYTMPRYLDREEALRRFLMDQRTAFHGPQSWSSLAGAEHQVYERLVDGSPWGDVFPWTATYAAEGGGSTRLE